MGKKDERPSREDNKPKKKKRHGQKQPFPDPNDFQVKQKESEEIFRHHDFFQGRISEIGVTFFGRDSRIHEPIENIQQPHQECTKRVPELALILLLSRANWFEHSFYPAIAANSYLCSRCFLVDIGFPFPFQFLYSLPLLCICSYQSKLSNIHYP